MLFIMLIEINSFIACYLLKATTYQAVVNMRCM